MTATGARFARALAAALLGEHPCGNPSLAVLARVTTKVLRGTRVLTLDVFGTRLPSPSDPARREESPVVTPSRRAFVAVLVLAILLIGAVVVVVLSSRPSEGPEIPTLYPYVNDLTEPPTLLTSEIASLDAMCQDLDDFTTVEFAVLIVNSTHPWGIARYASDTFDANNIGKEGKDNGILLLISVDEREWRIEVGYGLEGVLTDARVGQVGRDFLEPNLTAGDFYAGIEATISDLSQVISVEYDPGAVVRPPGPEWASLCAPLLLVLVILGGGITVVAVWYARRHPELLARVRTSSGGGAGTTQSGTQPPINLGNFSSGGKFGGGRSGGGGAGGRY